MRLSGGPFGWTYICGFVILMTISYNASWSLAQKYYSVRDEKEAAKAAYFAGVLNFAGAPLMILPAVIGRHLQPELMAQGRTADVYVVLVMKLLPAGMVGIIITAMFSATMAMVSADFNATAGVLTKDVFERLIRPGSSENVLLRVGRIITVGLGALTTLLSVWIALTQAQSLFSMMVTVLGTFMAPTLLPLLAGLTVRRLTWQGALAGFAAGLASGLAFLAFKPGSSYTWQGISLIVNAAVTILGMLFGTLLSRRSAEESKRVEHFFAAVDTPIDAAEVPPRRGNPSAPVLAVSTISVSVLIGAAGIISGSSAARWIDGSVAVLLLATGLWFRRSATRG
jgi:Na+/proline symporter